MDESVFTKALLECPVCLNEEEQTIWSVLDAVADPDLKDRLLRKTLMTQHCANCSNTWIPALPLLYRDENRRQLIYCHAGQSETQARAATAMLSQLPGWQLRLVADYNQLIEKIHIADHHCDDRLVEFVKLAIKRQGLADGGTIDEILFLTADDKTFRFMVAGHDGAWFSLDLESQIYLNAESLTEGHLQDETGQWQQIDETYAAELLAKIAGL